MRWTVWVEATTDAGEAETTELATITRPATACTLAEVGLMLAEAKGLLARLQASMVRSQVAEHVRWGIEGVIVSPGVYTSGTNHFANAGMPKDKAREAEYASDPTRDLAEQAKKGDENIQTENMDPADVGRAVVDVVALPCGKRPLRVTVDPVDGGADEINRIGDRVRAAYLTQAGMADLLHPTRPAA